MVPLHIKGINRHALEALVWLAARLQASLIGLIIENQTLFEAAELPFTTEVFITTGEERKLFSETLRRRHRRMPPALENEIEHLTAKSGVKFKLAYSADNGYHLGSGATTTQTLLDMRRDIYFPATRVILGADSRTGLLLAPTCFKRVKVFYDESPAAENAIQTLHALVGSDKTTDIVLISESNLPLTLVESLSGRGTRVRVQHLETRIGTAVESALRYPACELLVLPTTLAQQVPTNRFESRVAHTLTPILICSA